MLLDISGVHRATLRLWYYIPIAYTHSTLETQLKSRASHQGIRKNEALTFVPIVVRADYVLDISQFKSALSVVFA